MSRENGFLGTFSMTKDMPEFSEYAAAIKFTADAMPQYASIVSSSIASATLGEFGDFHLTGRTAGTELWINPLMAFFWNFRLRSIAERLMYLSWIEGTETRP